MIGRSTIRTPVARAMAAAVAACGQRTGVASMAARVGFVSVPGVTVHYVVVEEGVYTAAADGVKMEAQ